MTTKFGTEVVTEMHIKAGSEVVTCLNWYYIYAY